jgi:hypothetical protein
MTTHQGPLSRAAAYRAGAVANAVEANERRRRREARDIDWNEAIANVLHMLDDNRDPDV